MRRRSISVSASHHSARNTTFSDASNAIDKIRFAKRSDCDFRSESTKGTQTWLADSCQQKIAAALLPAAQAEKQMGL
jgi:hypothetical protein